MLKYFLPQHSPAPAGGEMWSSAHPTSLSGLYWAGGAPATAGTSELRAVSVSQSVRSLHLPPPRCLSEVLLYFSPVWRLLRYGPGHSRAWAAIEIEDLIICLISSIICPLHWADWYFVIPHIASLLPGPALYCIIDQSNWNSSLYAEFK